MNVDLQNACVGREHFNKVIRERSCPAGGRTDGARGLCSRRGFCRLLLQLHRGALCLCHADCLQGSNVCVQQSGGGCWLSGLAGCRGSASCSLAQEHFRVPERKETVGLPGQGVPSGGFPLEMGRWKTPAKSTG